MCIGYIYAKCGDSPDYGVFILYDSDWEDGIKPSFWERVNESVWMVPGTVSPVDD